MTGLAALLPIPVLFFALGFGAGAVRSDLSVPEALARSLSLYLMVAIGLKGGIAVATPGAAAGLLPALAGGVVLGLLLPLPAFAILRAVTRGGPRHGGGDRRPLRLGQRGHLRGRDRGAGQVPASRTKASCLRCWRRWRRRRS